MRKHTKEACETDNSSSSAKACEQKGCPPMQQPSPLYQRPQVESYFWTNSGMGTVVCDLQCRQHDHHTSQVGPQTNLTCTAGPQLKELLTNISTNTASPEATRKLDAGLNDMRFVHRSEVKSNLQEIVRAIGDSLQHARAGGHPVPGAHGLAMLRSPQLHKTL
jgi:hypothetical protein